jgi:hypothetical protein
MMQNSHGWLGGWLRTGAALVGAIVLLAFGPQASFAQTGPDLLIKPWQRDQVFEAEAQFDFYSQTDTNNFANNGSGSHATVTMQEDDSDGRFRLFPRDAGVRADPRVGYNLSYLKLNTNDPTLPKQLTDDSFAIGMGIADIDGWEAGITAGLGYAAAGAFNDGNGLYGQFDLLIGHDLSKNSKLGLVLDYNGNRTFLPDVPLPGIEYTKTIDPTLLLAAGFPLTSITWTPDKSLTLDRQLTVEADYEIPYSFEAKADYAVIDADAPVGKVGAFASFTNRQMAYHDNDAPVGRYRLFFEQNRGEVGVQWTPRRVITFVVAGGVAFDQRFDYGWDSINYKETAKLGDSEYARIGLELRY